MARHCVREPTLELAHVPEVVVGLGVIRVALKRSPEECLGLVQAPPLCRQHPEKLQHVGIVRASLEQEAIGALGLVEVPLAVQRYGGAALVD
jgi:hypothetical protein